VVDGGKPGVGSRDEGKHTGRNDLLFVEIGQTVMIGHAALKMSHHPLLGLQMQVGWVNIDDFRQITGYISKMVQERRVVSIKSRIGSRMRSIEW